MTDRQQQPADFTGMAQEWLYLVGYGGDRYTELDSEEEARKYLAANPHPTARLEYRFVSDWYPAPSTDPKDWQCGKCDGADLPQHFRLCPKRTEVPA